VVCSLTERTGVQQYGKNFRYLINTKDIAFSYAVLEFAKQKRERVERLSLFFVFTSPITIFNTPERKSRVGV
jgi:hypothetical protein